MKLDQRQVQHLLLRAGFGDEFVTIKKYVSKEAAEIFEHQIKLAGKAKRVKLKFKPPSYSEIREMSEMERQQIRKQARQGVKELNVLWIKGMVQAPSGLNEKLAFFWHDHFACGSGNPIFMQSYLDAIRENALGNFGDLLRDVSKSPAMLAYLNNQQNKKRAPNENFAREVMELFTLGHDNGYTEKDISEAARAFTGWAYNSEGEFISRQKQHDDGLKTVLGKTGNFDGDDILNMLLDNKQTAVHISKKWVRFFVNNNGDQVLENKVADALYSSGYDIKTALKVLFTDDAFFNEDNIGSRIKSPIELIVGMQRQLKVEIEDADSLIFLQRMLGQVLFDPPNVAGWPDGKEWIDSSSLMFRLNLPELVFKAAVIENQSKASFDDNDQFRILGKLRKLNTTLDLNSLSKPFQDEPPEAVGSFLIQNSVDAVQIPNNFLDRVVYYTSKPEYQLC